MNFSGIGGITIVVVAILWFFVFIPSWFNASATRAQNKERASTIKRAVAAAKQPILKAPKTKVSSLSEQVYRADRIQRIITLLTISMSLATAGLALAANKFEFLTPYAIACGVLALALVRALVMAKAVQRKLLIGSIRSRGAVSSNALSAAARGSFEQAAQVRLAQEEFQKSQAARAEWAAQLEAQRVAKEFVAQVLPAPSYAAQVGSLEVPNFAPVVELGDKVAAASVENGDAASGRSVDAQTINDIMRRRRASGE